MLTSTTSNMLQCTDQSREFCVGETAAPLQNKLK